MLTIPIMAHIKVDGIVYAYTWHDFGSYMRLRVFNNDKLIGHRDFPISTDQGKGVIEYTVRSLLREVQYGFSRKAV